MIGDAIVDERLFHAAPHLLAPSDIHIDIYSYLSAIIGATFAARRAGR
jgi:hypothetical protein